MTTPNTHVIPREIPEKIQPIITWLADSLDEVVNFGSNIIEWDNKPVSDGEENIAPMMLLRHLLDVVDSISILTRNATGDPAKILARAVLEITLYLEYLFEKDTHNRAMAFLVEDTIRLIKSMKKIHPNKKESKEMYEVFKSENLLSNLNVTIKDTEELDNFLKSKESLLQLPQFKNAYKEYEKLKKNGEANPKWYRYFNGPKNIEALAKHLKQRSLYEIIYRKWSGSVHGTDIYLGKIQSTEDPGKVDIVQIRFVKDVQEVVSYSLIMACKVFRLYIQKRIPGKNMEYANWYLQIRDSFIKITSKKYIKVE